MRTRAGVLGLLAALALALAGCGSTGPSTGSEPAPSGAAGASPSTASAQALSGPVTVFAAASLTEVFKDLGARFEKEHPGTTVRFSFAGSQSLVAQVQQGAPADVLATADVTSAAAVRAELAAEPVVLARNRLAVVTEKGNPRHLTGLADLARPGLRVVLAGPTVPAGKAAAKALEAAGVTVRPVSREADVKAVLQKVRLGEADAGLVYVTDVDAAGADVTGIGLPGISNAYPAAVLKAAKHAAAGAAFLALATSPEGRAAFAERGFLAP